MNLKHPPLQLSALLAALVMFSGTASAAPSAADVAVLAQKIRFGMSLPGAPERNVPS